MPYKHHKGKEKEKDGDNKPKSTVKIEEINVVDEDWVGDTIVNTDDDGEILLNSRLESPQMVTTDNIILHDWILDSGALFHVTPHKEWFTTYDAKRTDRVHLGKDYACEIMGVGDVQFKF